MGRRSDEDEIVTCDHCGKRGRPGTRHECTWESHGKIFQRCGECGRIYRVDGWFGDLHFCD